MRLRDLKGGTEYATCDGVLVAPETPIQRGWMEWVPGKKDTEEEGHYEFHSADELDPWGGCIDAKRPPQLGVLVRAYDTDRDGTRIGEGRLECMNARDIRGSWQDFMVLHGQKVRDRVDARERQELVRRLSKEVADLNTQMPAGSTVSLDLHYGRMPEGGWGNDEYVEHVDFTFKVEPEDLAAFLKKMGIKPPPGLVSELIARHRTTAEYEAIQAERDVRKKRKTRSRA